MKAVKNAVMVTTNTMSVCTHDGNFHVDEVLACCMLLRLPEYMSATIIRTRNPSVIQSCDIVVDVGGEYDPSHHRYDHHQRGFAETLGSPGNRHDRVKLSSAGLVYKHFGRRVLEQTAPRSLPSGSEQLEQTYFAFYERFIEAIDAIDNGIKQWPLAEGPPLYVQSTTLSARVARMNGAWNQEYSLELQNSRFVDAMVVVNREFDEMLLGDIVSSWLPGRLAVKEAIGVAASSPSSLSSQYYPRVLVFMRFCPWRDHLHHIEAEEGREGSTIYAVYPENDGHANTRWRVQAVNVGPGSFDCRLPFPEKWRGLNGAALIQATGGIPGCVFTHAGGFIAGNDTLDGALDMAAASLAIYDSTQKRET